MAVHPEIEAVITDEFKLRFRFPGTMKAYLKAIGAWKPVKLKIVEQKPRRSSAQNAYLWSVVYPHIIQYIFDKTGQTFTAEQLHDRYKLKYLGYEACRIKGMEDLVRPKSSTELDIDEFWDQLIEHICREWAELGLFIPLPKKKEENG